MTPSTAVICTGSVRALLTSRTGRETLTKRRPTNSSHDIALSLRHPAACAHTQTQSRHGAEAKPGDDTTSEEQRSRASFSQVLVRALLHMDHSCARPCCSCTGVRLVFYSCGAAGGSVQSALTRLAFSFLQCPAIIMCTLKLILYRKLNTFLISVCVCVSSLCVPVRHGEYLSGLTSLSLNISCCLLL